MPKRIIEKSSGTTTNDDGSIDLAPMYADEFCSIARRERALKELEVVTLNFVRDGLAECYRDADRLWKHISDDLDLDFNSNKISTKNHGFGGVRLIIEPLLPPTEGSASPKTATADDGGRG